MLAGMRGGICVCVRYIHEPMEITGRRVNAVLVSEDDWRAVQETLHLLSIPCMRESSERRGSEGHRAER
jgi:PHD/YefM family antitoxin component YafN of YafNO toxin-antitoxin module